MHWELKLVRPRRAVSNGSHECSRPCEIEAFQRLAIFSGQAAQSERSTIPGPSEAISTPPHKTFSVLLVLVLSTTFVENKAEASGAMATRPEIHVGQMMVTRHGPTTIRCKLYDDVYPHGRELATLEPGTSFGPVQEVRYVHPFLAVRIDGGWINVWRSHKKHQLDRGVNFAFVVS